MTPAGPPSLRPGSRIAVVGPSGRIDPTELQRGLEVLVGRGYEVVTMLPPEPHRYLAGSDDERLAGLIGALLDPQVQAIWAARGGYGAMRLLHRVPWDLLDRVPPRWVLGFSDVTALLLPLVQRQPNWGVVHGPNVSGLGRLTGPDLNALWALLEQGNAAPLAGLVSLQPGRAEGELLGGNLCLISHLAGTPYLPPVCGRLLLLEEVGERPYRLDRMLTQLGLSGWLKGAAGVVLGELHNCDEGEGAALAAVADVLGHWLPDVPVVTGLPVGHGQRNRALRLGQRLQLDADAGTLGPPPVGTVEP